jgi:hypothetical protein
MGIVDNALMGASGQAGYRLQRSLRTRASASAYLSRTFLSNGNQQRWTWSGWVKAGRFGSQQPLFNAYSSVTDYGLFTFSASGFIGATDTLKFYTTVSNATQSALETAAVFRDPASWYHIVLQVDTTQATASNRIRIYVNGVQQTLTGTQPSQNTTIGFYNTTSVSQQIGALASGTYGYFDGYLAEVNFIDGQALTPSSFGSTNALTGVWQPAPYTGAYGTNGFVLDFEDNSALTTSSNVGLGKDTSGNGNYWTTNNISITAGVTYDSMTDVPTLTSATAANFAVLNPLNNSGTLANANLTWNGTDRAALGTMALPITGKYYFEATCTTVGNFSIIGIADGQAASFNGVLSSANFRTYNSGGEKADSTRTASWGSTFTSGDVIGIAVDMDNGAIYFAKNNTWQASGVPTSGASKTGAAFTDLISSGKTWVAFVSSTNNNGVWNANHGQRPFTYTPPTGFVALNTFNLPTSTIVKGNTVMDATLWAGNNASPRSITNDAAFKPDLVWIKNRSNVQWHNLVDSVRGVNRDLFSNSTNAEALNDTTGTVSAFNTGGFSVSAGTSDSSDVNATGNNYVGWQWQAGQGTNTTNTNGTITSSVSVNASAGFSVVTYTGTGANATVGHGLGVAPQMVIIKGRGNADNWIVYNSYIATPTTHALILNSSTTPDNDPTYFNSTAPTSSVFSVGTDASTNQNTIGFVAYCWSQIAGFSSFGKYAGNSSTDGPFVYLGFRPKYVLIKNITVSQNWVVIDSARSPYNPEDAVLLPNTSDSEASGGGFYLIDMLSNGFKLRTSWVGLNGSGENYVYIAYAENPFKNSLAR